MQSLADRMISRREWLGLSLGAGATLALTPALLGALRQLGGTLIQRAIPSTGEMLPVIGLQFQNQTTQDPAALKAVLKTLVDHGGRFFDTMHQSGPGVEDRMAAIVTELGLQNKLFLGLRGSPPGPQQPGPAAPKAQIESLFGRFKVPKIDLVQLPVQADPTHWGVLKDVKNEGRIRYIGATVFVKPLYPQLESIMRNEPIDFIGVDYAVDQRLAEEKILPLAQERKFGVVAYFPFGINQGSLFRRVGTTPLPEWAANFDAKTWAQFFLKYVISHPAVTVVRVGTSQAKHMLDNIGGGIGRLPDEATRKRMAQFVDALPAAPAGAPPQQQAPQGPAVVLSAAILDRYVGEYKATSGFTMTFRRDGATLLVKPGPNPEGPLVAHSETRFSDPRGPTIEFQLDGQGKVTGVILEQGAGQRIPLERK